MSLIAQIALNVPLKTLFSYKVPQKLIPSIAAGKRVRVRLRRKEMLGICLELIQNQSFVTIHNKQVPIEELNEILEVVTLAETNDTLDPVYLEWLKFAADYYCTPIGQVLSQALPPSYLEVKKKQTAKKTKIRDIVFDVGFSTKSVELTNHQQDIFNNVIQHTHEYYPVLLHGVTGSGKTEIYIKLIHEALSHGKSALILVPEIGLTPQMLARLNHHFRGFLLVYHSGLSKNQRIHQWMSCFDNTPRVMVGTRSALFAPFKNLGILFVDEEHDTSYKQDDRFRYNARDLAVSRARILNIPVILGSATPSLESYHQSLQKKYHYFELKERIGKSELPQVRVVDFAKEKEQTQSPLLVSQNIHQAIDHFYKNHEQMLLFVGQRGFAQNAFCVACHKIQLCPNCSVGLKFHKVSNNLKCHYCDYNRPFDEVCSECHDKKLTLLGFGTQSIEEEILAIHPQLVVRRLDSDAITNPGQIQSIFKEFEDHKINMIIGTQMITKGHDFSNIGFVGILGVDAHLGLPDFRAAERSFQNIVQVAGRSGRSHKKGHVIIQSLMPAHMSVTFGVTQDFKDFANQELKIREQLQYPPFSRIIQLRLVSPAQERLKDFLKKWSRFLNQLKQKSRPEEMQILGPAEMPIFKVRGKYRYHVLIKIKRGLKTNDIVKYITNDLDKQNLKNIQYLIDVDPMVLV